MSQMTNSASNREPAKSDRTASRTTTKEEVVSFENEPLILVDDDDKETGTLDKSACHDGDGLLHRAFSLFISDLHRICVGQATEQCRATVSGKGPRTAQNSFWKMYIFPLKGLYCPCNTNMKEIYIYGCLPFFLYFRVWLKEFSTFFADSKPT